MEGLLKGFKLALRQWELLKNWWRYDQMKFVTYSLSLVYTTNLPTQDPYTMDIYILQTNDRKTLMHTGICFYCKEQGYLAYDCSRKSRTNYHVSNHNLPTHFPQNSSQNNQTPFQPHTHTVNIATIKATLEALIEKERS